MEELGETLQDWKTVLETNTLNGLKGRQKSLLERRFERLVGDGTTSGNTDNFFPAEEYKSLVRLELNSRFINVILDFHIPSRSLGSIPSVGDDAQIGCRAALEDLNFGNVALRKLKEQPQYSLDFVNQCLRLKTYSFKSYITPCVTVSDSNIRNLELALSVFLPY